MAEGAGREKFDDEQVAVTIHHQAGKPVAFRMHDAPGVAHFIETQQVAAQGDRSANAGGEEGLVHRLVGVFGQHAQGDARMAVVEAAADPGPGDVDDVHDGAGLGLGDRLFHHLLEDPGVVRAALDLQANDGQGGGIHSHSVTVPARGPADDVTFTPDAG